jgi:hypothetical protein
MKKGCYIYNVMQQQRNQRLHSFLRMFEKHSESQFHLRKHDTLICRCGLEFKSVGQETHRRRVQRSPSKDLTIYNILSRYGNLRITMKAL